MRWIFTTPVPVGDIAPSDLNALEVCSIVRDGDGVIACLRYGWTDGDQFIGTTLCPCNRKAIARIERYQDVKSALENLERALFRRLSDDGEIPEGSEG